MPFGDFTTSQFIAKLQAAGEAQLQAAMQAANEFNEATLSLAKELCPVDTGALVASGTSEPAELIGDQIVGQIGFNVHYAVYVHENLEANHPNGGQAKFLEAAMLEMYPKAGPVIAEAMKGVTG